MEKKDILGWLVEVKDPGTITTQYAYNVAGDLVNVTDSAGNVTAMVYNTLGLKTSMIDPDMGSWTYAYDQYGNLLTQTDAKGQTVTCSYDELNRILAKTFSTGDPAVTYVYDLPGENRIGRLASAGRGGHVTSYGYDEMGRAVRETRSIDGVDYVTQFTYDLSGKPVSVSYPEESGTVTYEYHDGSGLIHEVKGAGITYAALTDYTPTGQVGHIAYANGVNTSYAYDVESRRLTGINTVSGGNTLQSFLYGYTEGGDIAGVTRDGVVYSYTYDGLHRLVGESSVNGSIAYTYNNIGNLTQKVVFGNTLDYSYNDVAHNHAVSGIVLNGGSPMPLTYDANGNLLAGPDLTDLQNIESRTITWNAENMPVQIVHSQFGTCGFEYDGLGRRSKKVVAGGSVTRYIGKYYEKIDSTGTRYIFAGNVRLAKVSGSNVHYYHQDHLGSSTVMTDTNGVAQETTAYLPFGSMRSHTGQAVSNYKFTGQELDPETGLYYFNARYYDPTIGRFISADPVVPDFTNPQSLNRYSYCLNNPLIYIDPSGYQNEALVDAFTFQNDQYLGSMSSIVASLRSGETNWIEVLSELMQGPWIDKAPVIVISREESTKKSILGTGYIFSPKGLVYTFRTLEPRWGGENEDKDPFDPGMYWSFIRYYEDKLPRIQLISVDRYIAVQIHTGNKPEESDACILVGEYAKVDQVCNSVKAMSRILDELSQIHSKLYTITIFEPLNAAWR